MMNADRTIMPAPQGALNQNAPDVSLDKVRVGIFSVKFSPNLGDGLLSECLEAELRLALPFASIEAIDLAGRLDYVEGLRLRASALSLLHHSPRFVRHAVSNAILGRKLRRELRPRWRELLSTLDAVVIGGGNLLGDTDLNFPLKLDGAMAEVRAAEVPVGVFGVGASDNWSAEGESLFRRAFGGSRLYFASTRENRSADIWRRRLSPAGVTAPRVVHDPGVLTSIHFPRAERYGPATPLLGLGVTHPTALAYHSNQVRRSASQQRQWYGALVRACISRGWRLAVFSNGSPEDVVFLDSLKPSLTGIAGEDRIQFVPRFRRPIELAHFISTVDLLLAHRLHANIAAYSYAIPQIGFSWDVKLKSFLSRVGRAECIFEVGLDPISAVTDLISRELAAGVDRARHRDVLAQAADDVSDLGAALTNAVTARRQARIGRLGQDVWERKT